MSTQTLESIATSEGRAVLVRHSAAFCLEDAALIHADVAAGTVDGVVIAACSPRVNTDVFRSEAAFVERVNIREQVAWSHEPGAEETQSLANDYLRMGMVRAQKATLSTPFTAANERTVLVIGGGVAGLAAAADAAEAGVNVVLVEKTASLGGFAAHLHKQYPKRRPYREPASVDVMSTVANLKAAANVRIEVNAEVAEIAGQPGNFVVTIRRSNGSTDVVTAGAIVAATGWTPGRTDTFTTYGVGTLPNVVTSIELEEMAVRGRIVRPSDNAAARRVAILLCDGASDDAHLPYQSKVSSLVALKQALYVREQLPGSTVYVLYKDMQTPGLHEYFYKRVQEDAGILFLRGEVRHVSEGEGQTITIDVDDTVVGGPMRLVVDLLVASADMVPATLEPPRTGLLNLRYLQGPELPTSEFGFAESHFICFPYETRRTGIYAAGSVRQAMDLQASAQDGSAAALKAIQCIEQSSAGAAVHPRVGDQSFPEFFLQKCTSCGRCTQECPFGALELDDKRRPVVDPNRCRRCGICMGACPVQIISFNDYSVDMLSAMIRAVDIPEDQEDKPRILVFACENDAYPALDMAGIGRLHYPPSVRVIPVRCLGSVNSILIADAVSRGFDGVALMGCRSGEDYQCHFIRGSELLQTRMDNVRETLDRLALEPERVQVMEVAISDAHRIPELLNGFVETIKRVGPNPMKGF
jgi:quinone-modifying oxidoreductase subunit QmoB